MKYIFITGGVLSSVGKGVFTGSLGALLEASGHQCTCMKLDPYLNVDPGTMRPSEHGEVFVTADGSETDLDLGHYERFVSSVSSGDHYATTGKIYSEVIKKERHGDYLGSTVQVVPHITDHIQALVEKVGKKEKITLVEVGGTVGDIESLPFLEAIRQMRVRLGDAQVMFIHLTWLPFIVTAGELKTKPTQHSVKELRSIGIQPDLLICRSEKNLTLAQKQKIALFTNVGVDRVISTPDVSSIYAVPSVLSKQNVGKLVENKLAIELGVEDITAWDALVTQASTIHDTTLTIAIVGKYTSSQDAYKSLDEALSHAGLRESVNLVIDYIDSEKPDDLIIDQLKTADVIIVPGGFGGRGTRGKLSAINHARKNKTPFLGICLGMQLAVIEFVRNECGFGEANSTEFKPNTSFPIVGLIEELSQRDYENNTIKKHMMLGGTMRLGAIKDEIKPKTLAAKIYNQGFLVERHRHRYEVNPEYVSLLEANGMVVSAVSESEGFIDVVEISDHPWFLGCQFHPEFTSKPLKPSPLFTDLIATAKKIKGNRQQPEKPNA